MNDHLSTNDDRQLGNLGQKAGMPALLLGAAGITASVVIALILGHDGWERLQHSYLWAFIVVTTISLGALFFTMIQHATRAGWGVVFRRIYENLAANLIVIIPIAFIPVVLFLVFGDLYHHWSDPELTNPDSETYNAIIAHKSAYLNAPFWIIRAAIFLGIWSMFSRFFLRHSVAQDATGDLSHTHRMQALAPVGLILYALTQSFAGVDWIMSLESHWFSTMFGVYIFAASCCGVFSVVIIIAYFLQRSGKVKDDITLEHYQDAGKWLFAFGVVFWAYIAYSQYMLIWYANIPEETNWFHARRLGGWMNVSILLLVGHFAIPFILLVTKHTKRIKPVIAGIAGWMLLMHFVDMYWLVMPKIPHEALANATSFADLQNSVTAAELGYGPHLLDLTCLVGLGGILVYFTLRRMAHSALIPIQDPRLEESLAFENQ